jgi:hypothetical protein
MISPEIDKVSKYLLDMQSSGKRLD